MISKFSGDQIDEEELQEKLERFGRKDWDTFFYRAVCLDLVRIQDEKKRAGRYPGGNRRFFRKQTGGILSVFLFPKRKRLQNYDPGSFPGGTFSAPDSGERTGNTETEICG